MVLTASFVVSPETGLVVSVIGAMQSIVANLISAPGYQDRTTSPSASMPFVMGISASIASRINVRDDREAPLLVAQDARESAGDFRIRSTADSRDQLARRANQRLQLVMDRRSQARP
jgi:hypothetical protein